MMKKPKMPKVPAPDKATMSMPRFGARAMRPGGMAKGGKVHPDEAMDKKLIRKEIARAEKMEEKSEAKGMKAGGSVKKMFRGGTPSGQTFASAPPRPSPMSEGRSFGSGSGPKQGTPFEGKPFRNQISPQVNPSRPAGSTRPVNTLVPTGKPAPASMGSGPRAAPFISGPKRMMARGGGVEAKGKTKGKII